MNIAILDAATLGNDISFDDFKTIGEAMIYPTTSADEVAERISDADVVVINKIKLNEANLCNANKLKLICIAATGFDNVDIEFCKIKNIAVCNVCGYSTHSVAQITVATVMSLINHLPAYDSFVKDKSYTKSGIQNYLVPVYHELYGKVWGIIGYGNIGKQVGKIAEAFGCEIIVYRKRKSDDCKCVPLDKLMRESDIISIHLPLNSDTKGIIGKHEIALMKKNAIIVNAARGGVWDEQAITDAIIDKSIAGMGTDVYSVEPMQIDSPFNTLLNYNNVCFTPHMAWGAYEARVRCMKEIILNIKSFFGGEIRNRIDI